mmetsp:Transcript_257/g.403  ORF Transcript_257/g.403 Transcript_257/m.403 type:complete len:554 (-) Transcript_257:138-1799(-)
MGKKWVANLDMYRKVPADLLEGSREGRLLSWAALLLIITLFTKETQSFLESSLVTDLALDKRVSNHEAGIFTGKGRNQNNKIRVNFNITMLDLKCEYATIDVFSTLGHEQNVTQNVNRWSVDAEGIAQEFVHRNMLQHDIELKDEKVTTTIEEMHENGEDAISLDPQSFEFALREYQFVFMDFYASWCSHCRDLAPTWEALANVMVDAGIHSVENSEEHASKVHEYSDEEYDKAVNLAMPVVIAKIDCVDHHDFCREQGIMGYPTLRLFIDGKRYSGGDYYGNRNVMAMTEFLAVAEERYKTDNGGETGVMDKAREFMKARMNVTEEERQWAEAVERTRHATHENWNGKGHPGCRLSGELMVDRVPGNFYIRAQSKSHDLAPHMTNVSHIVHHLSFGDARLIKYMSERATGLAFPGKLVESLMPMEENVYITRNLHEAYHHYIKLIPTKMDNQVNTNDKAWEMASNPNLDVYQVLQSSELAFYRTDIVPEAKFVLDLSPIAVSYRVEKRAWYDYMTSLMAIIGGTFTVLGLLDSGVHAVGNAISKKKAYRPVS